jgi:hypothetical protein
MRRNLTPGDLDIAAFVKLTQQSKLKRIFRPDNLIAVLHGIKPGSTVGVVAEDMEYATRIVREYELSLIIQINSCKSCNVRVYKHEIEFVK